MTKTLVALILSLGLFSVSVSAALPTVKVVISNAAPATGTIEVTLFNSEESFFKEPFLQQSGAVDENGGFSAEFAGLAAGDYAVIVVHDENENGVLDTGFLGFGGEGVAYSNDAKPLLGRPTFDDAKFRVDSEDQLIEISLD